MNIKWRDSHIEVTPTKKPKKLTGTRFASILGLNPWSTPFEMWCACSRTYEKPFEDTIYTIAGKTIEPKQIEYMKSSYGMDNLRTPTDVFGKDYFNKTYGDFFKDTPVFGGMWDSILVDESGKPTTVLEFKTTKRSEDWAVGVPEYYALQAALYAYLLEVDHVIMIASFLETEDYEHPENFKPSAFNTITVEFKLSEAYPDFESKIVTALDWWEAHVETGVSPDFDEKKDADILSELRKTSVPNDSDIDLLLAEACELKSEIDAVYSSISDKEKRLKKLTDVIKERSLTGFTDGIKQVELKGSKYTWVTTKTVKQVTKLDEERLKSDGIYDKYAVSKEETSYRTMVKAVKEEK